MCKCLINAEAVSRQEMHQTQLVKNVHIGVFFDGSGSNMVREYMHYDGLAHDQSEYAHKMKDFQNGIYDGVDYNSEISGQNAIRYIYRPKYDQCQNEFEKSQYEKACNRLSEINSIKERVSDDLQSHPSLSPEELIAIEDGQQYVGFTNVALLYSLFTGDCFSETESYVHKIYVEGCGSTDISVFNDINMQGFRVTDMDSIEGFAVGTGSKGVTALVSKALKSVADYVDRLYQVSPFSTTLHFYVFGFSRGSACARLFCHLLTRDSGFATEVGVCKNGTKVFVNGKGLESLEKYKQKIVVDFLGLYDTVASIGLLQRKDGSSTLQDICGTVGEFLGSTIGEVTGGLVGGGVGAVPGKIIGGTVGSVLGKAIGGSVTVQDVVSSLLSGVCKEGASKLIEKQLASTSGKFVKKMSEKIIDDTVDAIVDNSGIDTELIPSSNILSDQVVWHHNNVNDFGLYVSSKIKSICHLCAMDEYRENYALVNLGKNVPSNALEIMIPGCHSDVGGSYLDKNDEKGNPESIFITKIVDRIEGMPKLCSCTPNVQPIDTNCYDVSGDTFKRLGWLDDKSFKLISTFTPTTVQYQRGMHSSEVTNYLDDNRIFSISRDVKRGYSDIPLAMMWHCCNKKYEKYEDKLFSEIPPDYNYERSTRLLRTIGNKFVRGIDALSASSASGRFWFFPESREMYKSLRLKYLHFSANDLTPIPTINSPNYNEDGVMCRITYHGDDVRPKDSKEGIHYLYELEGNPLPK